MIFLFILSAGLVNARLGHRSSLVLSSAEEIYIQNTFSKLSVDECKQVKTNKDESKYTNCRLSYIIAWNDNEKDSADAVWKVLQKGDCGPESYGNEGLSQQEKSQIMDACLAQQDKIHLPAGDRNKLREAIEQAKAGTETKSQAKSSAPKKVGRDCEQTSECEQGLVCGIDEYFPLRRKTCNTWTTLLCVENQNVEKDIKAAAIALIECADGSDAKMDFFIGDKKADYIKACQKLIEEARKVDKNAPVLAGCKYAPVFWSDYDAGMQKAAMDLATHLNEQNKDKKPPVPTYSTVEQTKVGGVLNDHLPWGEMCSLLEPSGAKYLWDIVSYQFATKFADKCARAATPHVVISSSVKKKEEPEAKCRTFRAIEGREMINQGPKRVIAHIFQSRKKNGPGPYDFEGPIRLLSRTAYPQGNTNGDALKDGAYLELTHSAVPLDILVNEGEFSQIITADSPIGRAISSKNGGCHVPGGDQTEPTCEMTNVGIFEPR